VQFSGLMSHHAAKRDHFSISRLTGGRAAHPDDKPARLLLGIPRQLRFLVADPASHSPSDR